MGDCYKIFIKYNLNPNFKKGDNYRCLHDFDFGFIRELSKSLYGFEINMKENWVRCYFCEHDDEEFFLYSFAEFVKFFVDNKIQIDYIYLGELEDFLDEELWESGKEGLEFARKYLRTQKIIKEDDELFNYLKKKL